MATALASSAMSSAGCAHVATFSPPTAPRAAATTAACHLPSSRDCISAAAVAPLDRGSNSVRRSSSSSSRSRSSEEVRKRQLTVRAAADGQSQQQQRKAWDVGRFLQTVLYFNPVQDVFSSFVQRMTGQGGNAAAPGAAQQQEQQQQQAAASGPAGSRERLVLVVGATGGVGKRVVDILTQSGVKVRALVRNESKARKLLGDGVELVLADLTQPATLLPEHFDGVTSVVNCSAVTVGPKEGDTEDRQKYYQGIKFYDPEIKGDTPEAVEFRGVSNLMRMVLPWLGERSGKPVFEVAANRMPVGATWGPLDDVVMGGVSESAMAVDGSSGENAGPVAVFRGVVSTDNNGGFCSVRTKNFSTPLDVRAYEGLQLRVFGDGQRYKLIVRTTREWDALGYTISFDTVAGQWHTVRLPFTSFVPVFRAKTVADAAPFNTASICSIQLMLSKFEYDGALNPNFRAGPFELKLETITAYLAEPVCPRFVHVGSAGVTRPKRPGLDLSKQPPAVRLNDELGGILTYKLAGEDVIRSSGVPFCILRPCALTEEPAGAPLQFDQGDNITGKIGREEVARICVAALDSPAALDKTFEVKSTIPFSQPFEVDAANPPPPTDYTPFFEQLKDGITGKELLV